jgi:hypothetical protein
MDSAASDDHRGVEGVASSHVLAAVVGEAGVDTLARVPGVVASVQLQGTHG